MKRRSHVKTAAALVTAALIISACTSGDDDAVQTDTEDATADADTSDTGDAAGTADDTADTADSGDTADTADSGDTADSDDTSNVTSEETPDTMQPTGDVGAVGGSACGTPHGPYDAAEPAGEVRVAWNDPLLSFNNNTTHANATANANVSYLMNSGFSYY